ncbi:MAG: sortase domain-bontaining protein [Anaerolineae bacterium]
MNAGKWKTAAILLWGGAAVLILAMVLFYRQAVPFIETVFFTQSIPTAPPLATRLPTQIETPVALMPFGTGSDESELPSPSPTALLDEKEPDPPAAEETPTVTVTSTEEPTPVLTPTPEWTGVPPVSVSIPAINLEAPVVSIGWKIETISGQSQAIWDVPDFRAAGWHNTSAMVGVPGNTVLNGHNTSNGEVFRYLYRAEIGDEVAIEGGDGNIYTYRIEEKYILREAGQPLSVRLENARYIQETPDERVTLVTCHPYGSLANRLVVIAYPVQNRLQLQERME